MQTEKDERILDEQVDLTNCEREPIHIPGSIQPHGLLLVLQEPELTILQISENTPSFLDVQAEDLLGKSLDTVLAEQQIEYLKTCLGREDLHVVNPIKMLLEVQGQQRSFDGVVHRTDGGVVLELEPAARDNQPIFASFYHVVSLASTHLQQAENIPALCQIATEEIRRITGFDRVMLYRFDKDWHGEVIAEDRRDNLNPYLGLHFPASDIPKQARELYLRNWLRLIANVAYQPARIIPTLNPVTHAPLDLSFSVLRSVSPMHIEYLKNMGVEASMSVSIIKNNRLWGLISCHHQTPRHVPYETRLACEFLGQILSLQLSAKEDSTDHAYEMQVKDIQARLLQNMLKEANFIHGLMYEPAELLQLVNAEGAVINFEDEYVAVGKVPAREDVEKILVWLQQSVDEDVYYTDSLPQMQPEFAYLKDVASGLLTISISRMQGHYILWFRPEVLQYVNWGGDPNKPVEIEQNQVRLHPRKSFEIWRQTIQQTSLSWKACEVDAAFRLRRAIIDSVLRSMVLRRADELEKLNTELEKSNSELDSFTYIVSHDLKEPLRGIYNYSLILLEDQATNLNEDGVSKLKTLVNLTKRMESFIDSLLQFSRVGRVDLAFKETNLNDIMQQTLEILHMQLEEGHVQIDIPRPLPTIICDQVRVSEIFHNLITNAIKYNDKDEKHIEIGFEEPGESEEGNRSIVFYVRDNGIGIREKHFDAIFRIFKRLHGRDKFGGGTGAGLTIVKRIVERHGGNIWLKSVPGEGSTFYFTLEKEG